ncbi:MAG: response regulator transcription factor [Alphaproteobacteria bacterium]|nr:response regulator transcription factor [Alphaproteobacteria bacterium]
MKILLVEDHGPMRTMIADHLVEQGFAVEATAHANDALAAVEGIEYDAIILDLGLPDLDGMEFLRRLRGGSRTDTPVLILTARDSLEDRVSGLNAGADDYVVKPFNLKELEARLRAVLRRPGPRRGRVYAYGAVTFDTVSREARVNETPLDLTRRETALLEELLRSPGHVIPKDSLEDRLYALDDAGSPNALEAAVSRLRKKLLAAKAELRIETKRGIGYRLIQGEA